MNNLQVFSSEQFGDVRTTTIDGEPWFVSVDVCECLGLTNNRKAVERLDDDEKMTVTLSDSHSGKRGGAQSITVVNESGLYTLVLGSRKPEAKAFKRWITHDVVPSIRKHGGYIAGQEKMTDAELMAKALLVASKTIEEREKRISELTQTVQIMAPKAEYYDGLCDCSALTGIRETAKELQIKESVFIQYLLDHRYCYRDQKGKLQPYAAHVGKYFVLKEVKSERNGWSGTQLMVTLQGRDVFRRALMVA